MQVYTTVSQMPGDKIPHVCAGANFSECCKLVANFLQINVEDVAMRMVELAHYPSCTVTEGDRTVYVSIVPVLGTTPGD